MCVGGGGGEVFKVPVAHPFLASLIKNVKKINILPI